MVQDISKVHSQTKIKVLKEQRKASTRALLKTEKGQLGQNPKKKTRTENKIIVDQGIKTVEGIYRRFKRCSGGADGGVVGLNGSVRATCLVRMLRALKLEGSLFVDFGAGDGRVLLAAMAIGALKALGYELPDNRAHRFVFDAVVQKLVLDDTDIVSTDVTWSCAEWRPQDIDFLREVPDGTSCVYTFWVGMPFDTQERILTLCARCPSIEAIVVFRDRKWPKPDLGPPRERKGKSMGEMS